MIAADELLKLDATAVVNRLKTGDLSSLEVLDALTARIESVEPHVNALPTLCFERAHDAAKTLMQKPLNERGVLAGLPVPIKDLNPVAGVRTTFGSRVHENFIPKTSDIVVQGIERSGGVIYAKSNTPEFGAGGNTFNDVFGITRNPFDLSLSPAGSSGGAAVALVTGEAWLAHGSDMAGSLRTPASFCGVTSLRPSPGLIASGPALLPFEVLGQNGPMARNISDLALFLDAMTGVSSDAALSKHAGTNQYVDAVAAPRKPLRIAYSDDLGVTDVDPEVSSICRAAIAKLSGEGAEVEESHPDLSESHFAFDVLRAVAYASGLGENLDQTRDLMKPEVVWNVEQGLKVDGDSIRQALAAQGRVFQNLATFLHDFDFLAAPAASVTPMPVEERYIGYTEGLEIPEYYRWLAIAYAGTTATQPIVTLPCGVTEKGLPVGLQLIGKAHDEYNLLSFARYAETIFQWQRPALDPVLRDLLT